MTPLKVTSAKFDDALPLSLVNGAQSAERVETCTVKGFELAMTLTDQGVYIRGSKATLFVPLHKLAYAYAEPVEGLMPTLPDGPTKTDQPAADQGREGGARAPAKGKQTGKASK